MSTKGRSSTLCEWTMLSFIRSNTGRCWCRQSTRTPDPLITNFEFYIAHDRVRMPGNAQVIEKSPARAGKMEPFLPAPGNVSELNVLPFAAPA